MQVNMREYIEQIPEVLLSILDKQAIITENYRKFFKDKKIKQIYIIGSGTSYHAGLAVKKFIEDNLKIKVTCLYASHFARNETIFEKNIMVIGISQGGQSESTYLGLKKAKENHLYTVAISANEKAYINEQADVVIPLMVGEEKCGAKTKGYVGTIVTLYILLWSLYPNIQQEYQGKLIETIHHIPDIINKAKQWYLNIKDDMANANRILVVGYDYLYADVLEGALKLLETLRIGVTGYDIEEFFHGIYNSINESDYIIYLASKSDYKERSIKLKNILNEWTHNQYMIGNEDEYLNQAKNNCIAPFTEDSYFSVIEYIIPLQILACEVSIKRGINPDIPKDPTFHQRIGSKK